jgi:hypothetical protein
MNIGAQSTGNDNRPAKTGNGIRPIVRESAAGGLIDISIVYIIKRSTVNRTASHSRPIIRRYQQKEIGLESN